MTNPTPLTSVQRFAIFQIVDHAIDVTQQGQWVASAEYSGANHVVNVTSRRVNGQLTDPEGKVKCVYMDKRGHESDDGHRERVSRELGELLDHLKAKLEATQ